MSFAFIEAEKAGFSMHRMCQTPGVSQSGFFAWRDGPACQRQRQDMVFLARIRMAFALSNGTFGSPRMHRDLVGGGHEIGRHRTARLGVFDPEHMSYDHGMATRLRDRLKARLAELDTP